METKVKITKKTQYEQNIDLRKHKLSFLLSKIILQRSPTIDLLKNFCLENNK